MDFEIPYFKKQAEKIQQQLADQEHKHEEYLRSAEAATKEFQQVLALLTAIEAEACTDLHGCARLHIAAKPARPAAAAAAAANALH